MSMKNPIWFNVKLHVVKGENIIDRPINHHYAGSINRYKNVIRGVTEARYFLIRT